MTSYPRQGQFDGFCGLYCVANILSQHPNLKRRDGDDIFHELLKAAGLKGWLTPLQISHPSERGYTSHKIAEIVQSLPRKFRAEIIAAKISKSKSRSLELIEHSNFLSAGARFVIPQKKGDHWVALTHTDKGEFRCYDPWIGSGDIKPKKFSWHKGVFIGPPELFETL